MIKPWKQILNAVIHLNKKNQISINEKCGGQNNVKLNFQRGRNLALIY